MPVPNVAVFAGGLVPLGAGCGTVTSDSFEVTIQRGKRRRLDPTDPGTCEVYFRNQTGKFDDSNIGSVSLGFISANDPLGVEVDGQRLFTGRIRDVSYTYEPQSDQTVRVVAYDTLEVLGRNYLESRAVPQQSTSLRVSDVLVEVGALTEYPSSTGSTFDVEMLSATTSAAGLIEPDTQALDYVRRLEQTEQGSLFCNRMGAVTWRYRYTTLSASNIEFTDQAAASGTAYTAVPFTGLIGVNGADELYNVANVTFQGLVYQKFSTASQDAYGIRVLAFDQTLHATDNGALGQAEYVVARYSSPVWRAQSVRVKPLAMSSAVRQELFQMEINDTARVVFTPPSGSAVSGEYMVTGISHFISTGDHTMTVDLSYNPFSTDGLFVLGTSDLDGSDVLGY